MPREAKVHWFSERAYHRCGHTGTSTTEVARVTCRVCWFHILANSAPWARGFLDDLRGQGASSRELSRTLAKMGTEHLNEPQQAAPTLQERMLGIAGPLTPEQEKDLQTFYEYIKSLREPFVPAQGVRGTQGAPVGVPGGEPEAVDGGPECPGCRLAGPLRAERDVQEAIRTLFAPAAASPGSIQPVMDDGRAPGQPGRVKEGQIAKQAGDAGQIRAEPGRDF